MSSIIEGYEYDIFVSYRQKDNKGDRWVSEFVEALKTELESTFKEEISVYFDINPHDGLLETHDVDASLKDKLKCLIFIPIISRTYCDPKSFAWEHEFKAFVELASRDQFGLKVKLPNGNVANRVLPLLIHELDEADIKLCESLLGGVLRGVEFIYKSAGVNRPLRSEEEKPHDNLNRTIYRDQINKVANAVKEIISGLRAGEAVSGKEKMESAMPWEETGKDKRLISQLKSKNISRVNPLLSITSISVLLVLAGVFAYPKIFKRNTLEKLRLSGERISVAVMPFQNMTNDTLWNVWQEGIQNELINKLTNSEELKVSQSESTSLLLKSKSLINYASITPSVASSISKKLDANVFIIGSIKQAGATIRLNAQLIDSKTKEAFKSFEIDGTEKNILSIIDSLYMMVKNILIITKLENGVTPDYKKYATTNSPEAYRYLIYGNKAFNVEDYTTARRYYLQALDIDTNFFSAAYQLSLANMNPGLNEEAKKWCLRIYKKRDQLALYDRIKANWLYALCFESKNEQIKYLKQLIEFDDQSPEAHFNLSLIYYITDQFDKTITEAEKTLEIYKKWRSKPAWFHDYTILGMAYHQTGQHKKAKNLYKKAEQDFPDNWAVIKNQAILSLDEGDTVAANRYIQKFITVCKGIPFSETRITADICDVYASAGGVTGNSGYIDKSEEYCYKLLSLEPENPDNLFSAAGGLIIIDRNINKALELVDRALKVHPDNYYYLFYKGWGLYKQGKYKEAVDILQRSFDLALKYAFYADAEGTSLLLEKAKKAVVNQQLK